MPSPVNQCEFQGIGSASAIHPKETRPLQYLLDFWVMQCGIILLRRQTDTQMKGILSLLPNSPDLIRGLPIQDRKPDHPDRHFKNPDLTKTQFKG